MSKEEEQPIVDVKEVYNKTENYIEENKKSLSVIIGGIVLIIGGYFAYNKLHVDPLEKEAQTQLFMAERYFGKDSIRLAINGDGNYLGFKDIIEEYGVTPSANLAHYYLGICYLKQQQFEEAIEYLKGFDSDDDLLYSMAHGAMGDAYMELNNTEDALGQYLTAANDKVNRFTTPIFLMKAGLAYELQGKYEQAAELYDRIAKEYPSVQEGRDAEKYLARARAAAGK